MSEQPQRPHPPNDIGPPPASPEVSPDDVLGGKPELSDDTPTIISRVQPRPNASDNLFSGILRGRRLAHFELIEPIGVGGMAAVLRARDTQLDRFVALKILPPEMASDPENVARFHQEARAAARLDHETIARVFYCGEDQSLHFIAFEFVEGENLRALIDRRGPLPVQEALHYMLQVATGLAHAAERGVVHRDIKPSNIIISPNGRAKLVDMGLARNLGRHPDDGLTQSGVTLGTFDYISPEQALEPRDADVRSDIYSLGCTFYHALTGRAPVPEGTAARKLHHHQHVPPIDPRQLNPDIPDDVAAILGRMMSKDPRQRYQRPEHLVQHLLQATHRAGGGVEGGDDVMFVDAALPAPPRSRPLLVAGCAAAIVVVLVLLIGPSHGLRSSGPLTTSDHGSAAPEQQPAVAAAGPQAGDGGGTGPDGQKAAPRPPDEEKFTVKEVHSPAELAEFAGGMAPTGLYKIVVAGDFGARAPVAADDAVRVVLRGKKVILTGADGQERPTIWTRYVADVGREWGLDFDADVEAVELHNLRVVADASSNVPPGEAAGVRVRASRKVTVTDCEFLQGSSPAAATFSSVAVQSPRVSFERCCFLGGKGVSRPGTGMGAAGWLSGVNEGGQTAVAVLGAAEVSAANCGFGPHAAVFRFERSPKAPGGGRLLVQRCTALAGNEWALAQVGDGASAAVEADHCLFARLPLTDLPAQGDMAMMSDRKPTIGLVRLAGSATLPPGWYQGRANCYLNIDAVRLPAEEGTADVPLEQQLAALGADSKGVLPAGTQPWRDRSPLALLQGSLRPPELWAAFRLDFNKVPGLVVSDPDGAAVVGMKESPWGDPEWGRQEIAPGGVGVVVAEKVVDPQKETDSARGVYKSLAAAVEDARTGGVIRIRHNRELKINPVKLLKSGVSLTIKPDEGSHPILMLDPDTPDPQAALFRVHGGQLTLEGLDFALQPQAGFQSQAVVMLFGDGSVQFRHCAVTLDGHQVPLAAVTLADPRGAMPAAAGAGVPKVGFDGCFVRGEGDLVAAQSSRPFDLDVSETLAALTGSLLSVDAGARERPAPPKPEIAVRLNQVTAYLGGYLVRLRAASLDSLVPVTCTPSKSLLVSAGDRKALLHLEAGPKNAPEAQSRVALKGDGNNYANFSPMLDQQSADNETATVVTQDGWRDKESETKFDAVKFSGPLWADNSDVSPARVSPRDFVVMTGPRDRGVSPDKVPAPAER